MSKRIFVSLLTLILLLSCGVTARCAWKWKIPEKWKKAMQGRKSASRILIEVAGKRKELKLGTNPVYIQGPEGDFRIVSYAWGAYSILGYSAPEISEAFCLSGVSGERGYKVDSNFSLIGDVNGDGYKDIASIDSRNRKKLVVFSGRDGSKLRDYTLQQKRYWYGKKHENLATYDHNGDGAEDFFTHTGKNLLLISAKDGNVLKTVIFPTYSSGRINFKLREIRDMDGDEKKDILLSDGRPKGCSVLLALSGKDGSLLKHIWLPEAKGYVGCYIDIFPDIDGDDLPEIMLGVPSSGISAPEGGAVLIVSSKIIS